MGERVRLYSGFNKGVALIYTLSCSYILIAGKSCAHLLNYIHGCAYQQGSVVYSNNNNDTQIRHSMAFYKTEYNYLYTFYRFQRADFEHIYYFTILIQKLANNEYIRYKNTSFYIFFND